MSFYFGLYDAGDFFETGGSEREIEINLPLIEELWARYGSRKAFAGWYVSQETSKESESIINIYNTLGDACKKVSGGLPVMISPPVY